MKYYNLLEDMSDRMRWRWHVGEILLPDDTEPLLDVGIRLDNGRPLRADVTHIGYVLDFCRTSFGVPIATKALADAIKSVANSDVQCLPITISGQTGMMVLNALRLICCIDERRSEFLKFAEDDPVRPDLAGQYRQVTRLVLNRNAIPADVHFFRIMYWEVALIVSEVVKDAMERVGCYGAEFVELEMA